MTYHWVCNKRKTTGATSGAETAYTSEYLSSSLLFSGVNLLLIPNSDRLEQVEDYVRHDNLKRLKLFIGNID